VRSRRRSALIASAILLGAPAVLLVLSSLPPFWDLDLKIHFFVHKVYETDWERASPLQRLSRTPAQDYKKPVFVEVPSAHLAEAERRLSAAPFAPLTDQEAILLSDSAMMPTARTNAYLVRAIKHQWLDVRVTAGNHMLIQTDDGGCLDWWPTIARKDPLVVRLDGSPSSLEMWAISDCL